MKEKLLSIVGKAKEKIQGIDKEQLVVGVMVTVGSIAGLALGSYLINQRSEEGGDFYDTEFISEVDLDLD